MAVIIVGVVVIEALVGLLSVAVDGDLQRYSIVVSPTLVSAGLSDSIFRPDDPTLDFPWWGYAVTMVVTILGCIAIMYRRYVRED